MRKFARGQDLTGMDFGQLHVLRRATQEESKGRGYYFWCRCSCGRDKAIAGGSLRSGASQTCGHNRAAYFRKHGLSNKPEMAIWSAMLQRCYNPASQRYDCYGARGITVCDRWRSSFEAFLADMGERPSDQHSIDRIDNNGNYEPGNCRWATRAEQNRNRRDNRIIEHDGRRMTAAEWSREVGISADAIAQRLDEGWPVGMALTVPPGEGPALRPRRDNGTFLPNRARHWRLDGSGHGYHAPPK